MADAATQYLYAIDWTDGEGNQAATFHRLTLPAGAETEQFERFVQDVGFVRTAKAPLVDGQYLMRVDSANDPQDGRFHVELPAGVRLDSSTACTIVARWRRDKE